MKIKLIESKENELTFELAGASAEMINSIRRAAVYKVPTLAIEDVFFTKNNSAMYDEQIASRLGLIPLRANLSKLNLPSECGCKGKGCDKCQVKVSLAEKGPKMVLAKDLKVEGAEALYPETPIVWLEDAHEIELTAAAVLGTGTEHAKWNTGWMFYKNVENASGEPVEDKFIVTIESWGQIAPKEILKQAAELVKADLGELKLE